MSNLAMEKEKVLRVNGHELIVTNPQKLYWPEEQFTKGDVINYYNAVYRYIIRYLRDRPESLRRNPNGIKDEGFFQKHAGEAAPSWVTSIKLRAESVNREIDYIVCNDKATLLYLNNLGCIELNPWHSRVGQLDNPDYLVMDIDPSEENSFDQVIEAAQVIREVCDEAGAPAYCKTSGATGLHVYIPLHAAYTYEETRLFAEIIATMTHERLPETTTTERSLYKRNGKIYLDHLQNKKGQTLACAYSLRPRPGATVSTPLRWNEVKKGLHPSKFTVRSIIPRLTKTGDLFTETLTKKINLQKCLKNLGV